MIARNLIGRGSCKLVTNSLIKNICTAIIKPSLCNSHIIYSVVTEKILKQKFVVRVDLVRSRQNSSKPGIVGIDPVIINILRNYYSVAARIACHPVVILFFIQTLGGIDVC